MLGYDMQPCGVSLCREVLISSRVVLLAYSKEVAGWVRVRSRFTEERGISKLCWKELGSNIFVVGNSSCSFVHGWSSVSER